MKRNNMSKIIKKYKLAEQAVDRIIEMAWEDRTPFDAIKVQFGLSETEVVRLMQAEMKLSSWKMWRERVKSRKTKHSALTQTGERRFHCTRQKSITLNKISKRK